MLRFFKPRPRLITTEQLRRQIGQETGVSRWMSVGQRRLDQFATAVEMPPEARDGQAPYLLVLSMLSAMAYDALPKLSDAGLHINHGFDHLKFVTPVKVGGRVRGRFKLLSMVRFEPRKIRCVNKVTVEIGGERDPALVADWLSIYYLT